MSLLLMYYNNLDGDRVYTLKGLISALYLLCATWQLRYIRLQPAFLRKTDPEGKPTVSAHPARFSPEDKFSRHRIITKKRFGLLPTQHAKVVM